MAGYTDSDSPRLLQFTTLRTDLKILTNWNVISSGFIKLHIMSPPLMEWLNYPTKDTKGGEGMNIKDDVITELKQTNQLLRLLILINVYGNENSVLDENIINSIKLLDNNHSAKTLFESKAVSDSSKKSR